MALETENEAGGQPVKRRRRWLAGGCLILVLAVILFLVLGGYYYTGSENFAEFVRMRVERNLESHFGRDVTIGRVRLVRSYPARIFIEDLRIANAPNGVAREFARVHQIEIVGGIKSFSTRTLDLGKIYVRGAEIHFEIYPEEHALEHNWPTWKRSKPRKYEITRMYLDKLYISGVQFFYNDIRREMRGEVRNVASVVSAQFRKGIYQGTGEGSTLLFQIQDYKPIQAKMRGSFYYKPGSLTLRSVSLNGRGVEAYLSGKIEPLTTTEYDFKITSLIDLARIQDIFRVEQPLSGALTIDGRLQGKQGNFRLTGPFRVPRLKADVYDIADLRGTLDVTSEQMKVHVDSGEYGGGSISADYLLSKYAEPYPMSVDLRYRDVSLEKLFEDWEVKNLGLRGAATGELEYEWNKEDILDGHGEGRATLRPGTVAFGKARYPMPVSGASRFALNRGVITFASSSIKTAMSTVDFSGTLAIETLASDLKLSIRSTDFSELDRLGYNIALSADKTDYELLGLGGSGTITGTLRGKLDEPDIVARIVAQRGQFNNQLLGDGEIDLRYAAKQSALAFDRATFTDGPATIGMSGTIFFPERGPTPIFDLRVSAAGWPADRAIKLVELELTGVNGLATGTMLVRGSPEDGTATFEGLQIVQNGAELRLNGDVTWAPGEGNITFNLDIGADSFPVADIAAFLELGEVPVTGEVTGTLHLEGHKDNLEGAGSVIVRNGAVFGEPIDIAMADLLFTEGVMRVTHLEVHAPAGTLSGEAEVNLANETFSYVIRSAEIDPTKLTVGSGLSGIFTGNVRFSSSGAGTFTQPELVLEAFVPEGTLLGRPFPEGGKAPEIYVSIRNGQITIRGEAFDIFSVEGSGAITERGDLSGNVRLAVNDIGRFLATFAPASQIPAQGNIIADLQLGGNTRSLESIEIIGTIPVFNLAVADQPFTIDPPARIALRQGRLEVESFTLVRGGATFTVQGAIALTGNQEADLRVNGTMDASLFELLAPGSRAKGRVTLTVGISGSLQSPRVVGRADLEGMQLKVAGFPQLVDDINGRVIFRGDRIELESIRAALGGGTVLAGGTVILDGMEVRRVTLTIQGSDVALRYFEGVTLEGDFNLGLSGNMEQLLLQGSVLVDRAVYSRDFAVTGAVLDLLLERRGLVPQTAAPWQQNVALRVDVSAPGTLAVDNNIAEITGSAKLEVSGTLASPILLGDIEIDEGGRIRFQDVDYRVTRGTVTFQNPFRIDPYFDITAEGRVQEYDLTVNLNGTMERIQTSVTSDPPVSDLTLLSLLGPSSIGQDERTSALAGEGSLERAGASLLYSSVGGLIGSQFLPFADSFRLDAGLLEGSSSPEPTVTFEQRISNDLRVIIVYNTADHTEDQQIVEWQVTPRWVLQFTRTGEEEYRGEARFRRRYNGYWASVLDDTTIMAADPGRPFTPPPPAPTIPRAEATQQRQELIGLTITSIEMRTDAPADTSHLLEDIPLKTGEALTIKNMQDSISRIYATGDFRDIRLDGTPAGGGVSLMFVLSLNYRVSNIDIIGAGRNRGAMQRELAMRVGDVLSLSEVDESAEAIRKELGDLGYLEATVDPETRFFREVNRAEVVFHVERGALAKISAIELEGDPAPFTEARLIDEMRQKPGGTYLRTRQKREADRVEGYLAEQDRRRAKVEFLRDEYNSETDQVRLFFSVEVGPEVEVKVEGVDRSDVKKWLPFRRDSERYSVDVVDSAADRIVTEYQRRGFYHAAVDMNEASVDGKWVITYRVAPGERYQLDEVAFDGNTLLEDRDLAEVITTSRPSAFRRLLSSITRRPYGVTGEQLGDDRDVLEAYYRLNGFPDAEVAPPVVQTSADGKMDVVFNITEGPQTIVTEVVIEGNEQFRRSKMPDLQLEVGEPFNPQVLEVDKLNLQTFYADQGYVEMQVKPLVETSPDKTSASVTFRISEGPKVIVDEVSARGNTFTDTGVIFRSAGLKVGDPFTYRKILEAQRSLYRLGIFRRVDLFPETAGTDVTDRDIAIEVEEGQNLSTAGSFGYSTDEGASVSASIAHRNLFGTARYLGLEARVAQETDRFFLTYREPFTFGLDVPTQVTFFRTDEEDRPGARIQAIGTFVEASKIVGGNTRFALRYEYEISKCAAGDLCDAATGEIPIEGLPLEDQEVDISSVTPSVFWDRRDDPFAPHRGLFASASLEYAFPFRQATAQFLKGFAQGAWYLPTGARSEFVLSARIGLIDPYGGTGEQEAFVPYPERFVAGGISSHRAFDLDELGIEGETLFCFADVVDPQTGETVRAVVPCAEGGELVPFGGNALVLINAEYRFPIFDAVRGALFVDAGNVWSEIGNIDYDELRYGLGAGVRYVTPVGPLRVDFGWKLDREEWEDSWAIAITLGYPF